MKVKRRYVTDEERALVMQLKSEGIKNNAIAKQINRSQGHVNHITGKATKEGVKEGYFDVDRYGKSIVTI